jgi:hypothetical protein
MAPEIHLTLMMECKMNNKTRKILAAMVCLVMVLTVFAAVPASANGALEVQIDIKPGNYPNSIKLGSNGVVPVAILTTDDFDATTVDPLTVELQGLTVRLKGKSGKAGSLEDVDGDGDIDLVVKVNKEAQVLSSWDTEAWLFAQTHSGEPIQGLDSVRIIRPKQ